MTLRKPFTGFFLFCAVLVLPMVLECLRRALYPPGSVEFWVIMKDRVPSFVKYTGRARGGRVIFKEVNLR